MLVGECGCLLLQVDVAVLKLTPLVEPAINVDYDTLEELVKGMFKSRRKMIRHGAKSVTTKIIMFLSLGKVSGSNIPC